MTNSWIVVRWNYLTYVCILSLEEDVPELTEHEACLSQSIFNVCLQIYIDCSNHYQSLLYIEKASSFPRSIFWRSMETSWTGGAFGTVWCVDPIESSALWAREVGLSPPILKDGPARQVIEGLSGSGSGYSEAIKCLHKRYDKPRPLHLAHMRAIVETPAIKEGTVSKPFCCYWETSKPTPEQSWNSQENDKQTGPLHTQVNKRFCPY